MMNTTADGNPAKQTSMLTTDAAIATDENPAKQNECSSGNRFYHAGILYHEDDYPEVDGFMEILREVVLKNGIKPLIDLFDSISPSEAKFAQIERLIEKCSFIIIYLTAAFVQDRTLIHHANEVLINAIHSHPKTFQLVLVCNEDLQPPVGMTSLTMIKWHKYRDFALKRLTKSLQEAQNGRKSKEKTFNNSSKETSENYLKSPTPSTGRKPLPPGVTHTTVINVINATNVQIGNNPKMYGASLSESDSGYEELGDGQTPSPQINSVQPSLVLIATPTEDKSNIEYNVSGPNVQIAAPLQTPTEAQPDSTTDSQQ